MMEILLTLLRVSVSVLILAIGMGSTFSDLTYLWRRPALLLRSLLAMYVLVPLAALALVMFLPLVPGVKAAFLVLAVSAGAPLLPRKLGGFGGGAYVFSLVVTSSLLAILVVPAWVSLLASYFEVTTEITPAAVALAIAKAFLLPLAVGMAIRALAPKFSDLVADRLLAIAGIVLTVTGLVLLAGGWQLLLAVKWPGMVTLVGLLLVALAIGHALGGPDEDDRTALAISCATRHIGVAVIVAATFRGPKTAVLIAAYIVASALVSMSYLRWRKRKTAKANEAKS
jgi:bile acid:Na+ symporter, BASS family